MSLLECRLVLMENERIEAGALLSSAEAQFRASAAKFGGRAAAAFDAFMKQIREIADPSSFKLPASRPTRSNLTKLFGMFGISPSKN
jgi:hypothetical protein